ncbi:hypothetical protein FI667_g6838, partial [Globisporangium splendens]
MADAAKKKSPKSAATKRGKRTPAARANEAADAQHQRPSPGGSAAPLTPAPVVQQQPTSAAPILATSSAQQQGQVQAGARMQQGSVSASTTAAAVKASSLQSLAQQQDEYRRKLEQLQRQHELQQQQWQLRQAAQVREQQMKMQEQAERQDRMQHIQQKLQERIQYKQQQPLSTSTHTAVNNSTAQHQQQQQAAVLQMRQAIIRREEKEMSQSLAEHQIQLYKAMMRDLELQSGIPMTPSMGSPTLSHAHHSATTSNAAACRTSGMHPQASTPTGAELIPAPIPTAELIPAPITTGMLPASTAKVYEDFQRARQEQLNRLQHMQQEKQQKPQHTAPMAATPQPTSKPLSIATTRDHTVVSEDAIRQQLLAEQGRLRILQSREMEHHQHMQRRGTPMSSQEQLLIQQHDILRQQQMLQGLLHKQQLERQQQALARSQLQQQQARQQMHAQVPAAQRLPQPQQPQQQKKVPAKKTPALVSTEGGEVPPPTKKRKKNQSTPESQMEALARELVRINGAKTAVEMRTSLDKMTAWVHRSFDTVLLRFAQRDFRDTINVKRQALTAANQWTPDIQVKSEYIVEKIAQIIAAFAVQQKVNNAQHPAQGTQAGDQTGSGNAATEREVEVREHAYKAIKAQMMEKQQQKERGASGAGSKTSGQSNAEKKKKPLFVDLSQMSSKISTPAANANQAQQATQSASGIASTANPSVSEKEFTATPAEGAIPAAQMPTSTKSVLTPVVPRAPLSPRVVQQLYEIDLSSRSCNITADESEDKFYIPMKSISKVMRRALPGGSNETTAVMTTKSSAQVGVKDSVQNVAAATPVPEPSAETNDNHICDAKSEPEKQEPEASVESHEVRSGERQVPAKTSTEEANNNADATGDGEKATSSATPASPNPSLAEESRPTTRSEAAPKTTISFKHTAAQVPGIKIDDDAAAFMQECVTEFILFLTSEAKDHCALDKKKSTPLLGSHVVQGMSNLGFSTYAKVLDTYNAKLKKMQDVMNQKKLIEKKHRQQHKQLEALAAAKAAAAASALQSSSSSGIAASNAIESKVAVAGVTLGITSESKQNSSAAQSLANAAGVVAPATNAAASQASVNAAATQ